MFLSLSPSLPFSLKIKSLKKRNKQNLVFKKRRRKERYLGNTKHITLVALKQITRYRNILGEINYVVFLSEMEIAFGCSPSHALC